MTLEECYAEHSYYYSVLEIEMKRIMTEKGLDGFSDEVIEVFCNQMHSDHELNNTKDYKDILNKFQHFASGIIWALTRIIADGQQT